MTWETTPLGVVDSRTKRSRRTRMANLPRGEVKETGWAVEAITSPGSYAGPAGAAGAADAEGFEG